MGRRPDPSLWWRIRSGAWLWVVLAAAGSVIVASELGADDRADRVVTAGIADTRPTTEVLGATVARPTSTTVAPPVASTVTVATVSTSTTVEVPATTRPPARPSPAAPRPDPRPPPPSTTTEATTTIPPPTTETTATTEPSPTTETTIEQGG